MSIDTYTGNEVKRLGQIFKLLLEPNRLRIVCEFGLECRSVYDIVNATDLNQTNVSFHLRTLREAGLVRPERRGTFIYYCLPDRRSLFLLDDLHTWMKHRHKETTADLG